MKAKQKRLEFHPAANIFPLMSDSERERLKADLIANGQHEDIIEFDGKILDGRNRYLCCLEAGLKPGIVTLQPDKGKELDPVQFVISQNLHRRQLTNTQRAFCAARMANMPHGVNKGRKPVEVPIGTSTNCIEDAASLFNVSRRNLLRAKSVLRQGCAELVDLAEAANSVNAFLEFTEYMPGKSEQAEFIKAAKLEADKQKQDWKSAVVKAIRDFNKEQKEQAEIESRGSMEPTAATAINTFDTLAHSIETELSKMPDNSSAVAALDRMLERYDERSDFDRLIEIWQRMDSNTQQQFRKAIGDG